ncbi:hypothetical protein [Absidia glauca]|uniref:HSF-type DNA-binding domain-containing protein n=1 Tax=Absidia glauca TaxID=4829 RepID=A0A163JLH6_ABSGL|nr:hypothetical protein [Absidia glauca]
MNVYLYSYNSSLLLDDDGNHGEQVRQQVETNDENNNHDIRNDTTVNATGNASTTTKEYHSDDTTSTSRQLDAYQPEESTHPVADTQVKVATLSSEEDPSLNCPAASGATLSTGEPTSSTSQPPTLLKEEQQQQHQLGKDNQAIQHTSSLNTATLDKALPQQDQQSREADSTPPLQRPSPPLDHEYLVKSIDWLDPKTNTSRVVRIITQNENGPCPLVSICNVLFIRGDLNMRPFEREKVTFEYLLEILGDYLVNHAPSDVKYVLTYRHNLDMALTILPRLQTGLDVNVGFSSIRDFEPTEELALFDLFDVDLVHGWIIDPQDEEGSRVVNQCKSYNGIVECIVRGNEADMDTGNDDDQGGSADKETKIHDGLVASQFLDNSATQLTYYGIALLTDTLPKNKLCVLFRNNHFSTLYKHPVSDKLYTLVTDSGLVSESNVVWETLGDVDQATSEFVNSQFCRPPPARISSTTLPEQANDQETADLDYAIALSLQHHQQEMARTSQLTIDHISIFPLPVSLDLSDLDSSLLPRSSQSRLYPIQHIISPPPTPQSSSALNTAISPTTTNITGPIESFSSIKHGWCAKTMKQGSIIINNRNNGSRSSAQTNLQQNVNSNDRNNKRSIDQPNSIINNTKRSDFQTTASSNTNNDINSDFDNHYRSTQEQQNHMYHNRRHHQQQQQHSTSPTPTSPKAMADPNHTSTYPDWSIQSPTDRTNSKRKAKSNDGEPSSNRPQAAFINKLYKMLEDETIQCLISWSEKGDLFSVGNPNAFSKLVLPQYFKHNNWQSFVRQLNMYGFHKVNDMIHSNLTSESQKWEFKHQNFRRGAIDELQNIKRKSAKSHHQYLPGSVTGSLLSRPSMGRLHLDDFSQQQYQLQATNEPVSVYQRGNKPSMIKNTNDSNRTISNSDIGDERTNRSSAALDHQPDPLYGHVLQIEDRLRHLSKSHGNLKSEIDQLKAMLTQRNSIMEDISGLLMMLVNEDGRSSNPGTVERIKKTVSGLRESILDSMEPRASLSGVSVTSSSSSSSSPYMPHSDTDNSDSRKSSIAQYSISDQDHHYCDNSDRTSGSRNPHSANDGMPVYRSNNDQQDAMPISSILSRTSLSSHPTHHSQQPPESHRRLPSIDVVRTEPFLSTDPPSPHHRLPHRPQDLPHGHPFSSPSLSSTTSTTSLSPSSKPLCISSSSAMDLDRPIPPLKPLRSIRSFLESSGDLDDGSNDAK